MFSWLSCELASTMTSVAWRSVWCISISKWSFCRPLLWADWWRRQGFLTSTVHVDILSIFLQISYHSLFVVDPIRLSLTKYTCCCPYWSPCRSLNWRTFLTITALAFATWLSSKVYPSFPCWRPFQRLVEYLLPFWIPNFLSASPLKERKRELPPFRIHCPYP